MRLDEIVNKAYPTAKKIDSGNRVTTGVRQVTVPAPGGVWTRIGSKYPWHKQLANYQGIEAALNRNGHKLTQIASSTYKGTPAYTVRDRWNKTVNLTSFVAIAPGVLVWQKYEGETAGGGQNYIYVGGEKIKTTWFLSLSPKKQDQMIDGTSAAKNAIQATKDAEQKKSAAARKRAADAKKREKAAAKVMLMPENHSALGVVGIDWPAMWFRTPKNVYQLLEDVHDALENSGIPLSGVTLALLYKKNGKTPITFRSKLQRDFIYTYFRARKMIPAK